MDWREKLRRNLARHGSVESTPVPASHLTSVLVPIGWNRETRRDEILLTKRTMHVETHKGQVSFPGGFCEDGDCSLVDTALRESLEEIGTRPADIEVLGPLPLVTTRGNIQIFPWVGRLELPYPFNVNPDEVEKILHLPLTRLLDEGMGMTDVGVGGATFRSVSITVDGELVWGATARMLQLLRETFLA